MPAPSHRIHPAGVPAVGKANHTGATGAIKFTDSPFKVAVVVVAVSVVALWMFTGSGHDASSSAGASSPGRYDIQARRRQSMPVVPPEVVALVALVGHDDGDNDGDARSAFEQFRLSHPPQEAASILAQLATTLFDVNEAFEDEPAATLAAQVDVQRLVKAVRALSTYAMCLPHAEAASNARGEAVKSSVVGAVACAGWLNPVVLPQQPSLALWTLAGATAFAQGVAVADYYRLLERDDLYSAALATAMDVLALSTSPRGQQLLDYASGAAAVAAGGIIAGRQHSVLQLFVSSTMTSPAHVARRRASMLEELIALNPEFGPLRLYYLAAILFDMDRAALPASLELVNRELANVDLRQHKDYRHTALLHVMRLYVTALQEGKATRDGSEERGDDAVSAHAAMLRQAANAVVFLLEAATSEAERGDRPMGCASLLLDPATNKERAEWKAIVGTPLRPPLLQREHAMRLLEVVKSPLVPIMGAPAVEAVVGTIAKLCDV